MNFDFSEEQKALRDSLRRFLSDESGSDAVRAVYRGELGYDPALWAQMGEMGLNGAAFAESHGGSGAGYLELCVVAEELGRALAPVPFLSSIGLAAELLIRAGSEDQKRHHLPGIAEGRSVGTVVLDLPRGALRLAGAVLDGVAPIVADAGIANFAIVACGEGEALSLGIVDLASPTITIRDRPSLDPCHRFGDISFSGTPFERL